MTPFFFLFFFLFSQTGRHLKKTKTNRMLLVVVSRCRAEKKKLNKVDQKNREFLTKKQKTKNIKQMFTKPNFYIFVFFAVWLFLPKQNKTKKKFHAFHLQPEQKKKSKKKNKKTLKISNDLRHTTRGSDFKKCSSSLKNYLKFFFEFF